MFLEIREEDADSSELGVEVPDGGGVSWRSR